MFRLRTLWLGLKRLGKGATCASTSPTLMPQGGRGICAFCVGTAFLSLLAAPLGPVSMVRGDVINFGSDLSWNVSNSSNSPIGNAQYVVLSEIYPTVRPPGPAMQFTTGGFGWLADLSTTPNAYWIWAPGITADTPNPAFDQYYFSKQFTLAGKPL